MSKQEKKQQDPAVEEVPVEVGVSNGNYVEIKSGLSEGDEVYVEAKVEAAASGLSGLLSGLFGGQQMNAPQAGGNMGRGGYGGDMGGGFSGDMGSKPERNYSGGGNP